LQPPPIQALQIQASEIKHPLLAPVTFTPRAGLTPDQAAVLAVLINPSLRAMRDRRGVAMAELFQAGILPNPQISGSLDFVTGGTLTPELVTGYGIGASWDLQALIQCRGTIGRSGHRVGGMADRARREARRLSRRGG
jgi:hypothetical protein